MKNSFAGRRILVGVTGSIAAFKVAGWVSTMAKEDASVSVIMTESAQQFITPLTFSALTGQTTYTSMFNGNLNNAMSHIELAQDASIFLVAPASAQTIARLAHGMADDLLSTTILATRAPVVICPAMNPQMYLHQATQENLQRLKSLGYHVVDPESGVMACKDIGPGRLPEWENVEEVILRILGEGTLCNQKVLVTAGPTREPLDPARFLSNRSSGKMGYAIARVAYRLGAEVTLVSGPTTMSCPFGVRRIDVTTAEEMYKAVMEEFDTSTIIVKSAAVSDFRPAKVHNHKVKKDSAELHIELQQNTDILKELGERADRYGKILIGFAAESQNVESEGRKKLLNKNLDAIAVNDIGSDKSGFEVDTNKILFIDKQGCTELPLTSKLHTAEMIWQCIIEKFLAK